jgi:hypothetical protein
MPSSARNPLAPTKEKAGGPVMSKMDASDTTGSRMSPPIGEIAIVLGRGELEADVILRHEVSNIIPRESGCITASVQLLQQAR